MTGAVGSTRGRALDDRTRVACDVARALYEGGRHGALGAFIDNMRAKDEALAAVARQGGHATLSGAYECPPDLAARAKF